MKIYIVIDKKQVIRSRQDDCMPDEYPTAYAYRSRERAGREVRRIRGAYGDNSSAEAFPAILEQN